jgi:hypothetical protein
MSNYTGDYTADNMGEATISSIGKGIIIAGSFVAIIVLVMLYAWFKKHK